MRRAGAAIRNWAKVRTICRASHDRRCDPNRTNEPLPPGGLVLGRFCSIVAVYGSSKAIFSNAKGDIFGGITAGIVALPLALGFGVASGMENGAVVGMYGAIIVGMMAALFGGTPSQLSGPTGPMTVVVPGIAAGLTGDPGWVFAMVALAGLFQIAM
ncbi:MAG: SulP family inorganic anion transporter [Polyangiaceae bacterium]|nr:SulP family inorganic anion transporter [Polyangiaceae bacterium]